MSSTITSQTHQIGNGEERVWSATTKNKAFSSTSHSPFIVPHPTPKIRCDGSCAAQYLRGGEGVVDIVFHLRSSLNLLLFFSHLPFPPFPDSQWTRLFLSYLSLLLRRLAHRHIVLLEERMGVRKRKEQRGWKRAAFCFPVISSFTLGKHSQVRTQKHHKSREKAAKKVERKIEWH